MNLIRVAKIGKAIEIPSNPPVIFLIKFYMLASAKKLTFVLGRELRAWAQAKKVEPVVHTSSTNKIRLPAKGVFVDALKMAHTFSHRSSGVLLVWLSVARKRQRVVVSMGVPHTDCNPRAIHSDWLNPRSRCLSRWSGTGTK